jgi:hypothetical protein
MAALRSSVEAAAGQVAYDASLAGYVVFVSVCDGVRQAGVSHAWGATPQAAFGAAARRARRLTAAPVWVKADLVVGVRAVDTDEFVASLRALDGKSLREGIAFDIEFRCAFLDAEVNANNLISYGHEGINTNNISFYLATRNENGTLRGLGPQVFLFTTVGFLADARAGVIPLCHRGASYGRRETAPVGEAVAAGVRYLTAQAKDDGSFVYGYYPVRDRAIDNYNIVRHAGTTWCLINQYDTGGDATLVPVIDKALAFLGRSIERPRPGVAHVVERKAGEVKLGGDALAVLAYASYLDVFGTSRYEGLVRELASGIVSMSHGDGTFTHVLGLPDHEVKHEFRSIYYDGEAAYALVRAYETLGDTRYLDAARACVGHFIDGHYERYRDHWVAYAVNELTKHDPDERYLTFGLLNAQANLDRIDRLRAFSFTPLEMLLASYDLYGRVLADAPGLPYLREFDAAHLVRTIEACVDRTLSACNYPESAMYLQNPARMLGSFFVRHDHFRTRIDDMQHALTGLSAFAERWPEHGPHDAGAQVVVDGAAGDEPHDDGPDDRLDEFPGRRATWQDAGG